MIRIPIIIPAITPVMVPEITADHTMTPAVMTERVAMVRPAAGEVSSRALETRKRGSNDERRIALGQNKQAVLVSDNPVCGIILCGIYYA